MPEGKELTSPETGPKPRELELIFLRHGKAESQEPDAALTEQGREQAVAAAAKLLDHVTACSGGVIKIVRSPILRAIETGDVLEQTIARLITERQLEGSVRLLTSKAKKREPLRAPGIMKKLKQFDPLRPIENWIENPNIIPGSTPSDVVKPFQAMIGTMQKVTDKLPPGERVFYVGVTHEPPQAALLGVTLGKNLKELGGPLKNCESVTIHLTASGKPPQLEFRGQTIVMNRPE